MSNASESPNLESRLAVLERSHVDHVEHCYDMRSLQHDTDQTFLTGMAHFASTLYILLAVAVFAIIIATIAIHLALFVYLNRAIPIETTESSIAPMAIPTARFVHSNCAFCTSRLFSRYSFSSCFSFACFSALARTASSESAGTYPCSISRDLRLYASFCSSWSTRYWAGDCTIARIFSQDSINSCCCLTESVIFQAVSSELAISDWDDTIRSSSLICFSIARYGAVNFSISE